MHPESTNEGATCWQSTWLRHSAWLRTVLTARLGDSVTVEEILQDVAVTAWQKRSQLSDPDKIGPWLYRIAIRKVQLFWRQNTKEKTRRRPEQLGCWQDEKQLDPVHWMISEEAHELVRAGLKQLNAQDREVLMLKHTENWTYRELSDHIGISVDKVIYRLSRARKPARKTCQLTIRLEASVTNFETQLQWLVDGELDRHNRAELLEQCDKHTELWRQLGMAFVENQIVNEVCAGIRKTQHQQFLSEQAQEPKSDQTKSARSIPMTAWFVALAASLLLGIFLGGFHSSTNNDPLLVHSNPNQKSPLEKPEFVDLADAISRSSLPIPTNFRRELLKAGFHVDELQRMTTVDLPIGGSVEIPIRHVEIKYLGSDLYQ